MVNLFQGLLPIERTQGHILVPLVPLVSHIPRNGTEQDAGIRADFVPLLYRFVSAVSDAIQAIQPIHGRLSLENVDDFCSICSACPTHSVERNGTRPMVWADRYGRSAPVQEESGQSQFAPLKLRSLALVPSSGALSRPFELHLWQLHCKTLPSAPGAPVRDLRPFRAPASPVLMRGVSDGRNVLPLPLPSHTRSRQEDTLRMQYPLELQEEH